MKTDPSAGRQFLGVALVAAGLTLQGCTEILRADFDDLEFGESPAGSLPGPPSGDSAEVTGSVFKNGTGISLSYDPSRGQSSVDFVTGGKPHNTTDYSVQFWGLRTIINAQPIVVMETLDTRGNAACGLQIAGGQFRLVSGAGTSVIGSYDASGTFHDVFIRLDRVNRRCFLLIRQARRNTSTRMGHLSQTASATLTAFASPINRAPAQTSSSTL
jgi:hypothetical protein